MEDWSKWDPRDLGRLLSPTRWSPAVNKQDAIDHHVEAAMLETKIARREVPCKLDIPYGDSENEKLDIYGTDLGDESPVFLWVHGGAWLTGHKDWSGYFIRNVYSWGFKSVVVGYPLAPDAKVKEMCIAIQTAVEKAISLFPRGTFILSGHSAGAHLVANILCGNSHQARNQALVDRIAGLAFFSGLFDIRCVQPTIVNEGLGLSQEEATRLSPLLNTEKIQSTWLSKRVPLKVLLAVGKFDPPEFQRQSQELCKALRNKGFNETSFWVCEEDDHYTIVENFSRAESLSGRKLKQFLLATTVQVPSSINNYTIKKSSL